MKRKKLLVFSILLATSLISSQVESYGNNAGGEDGFTIDGMQCYGEHQGLSAAAIAVKGRVHGQNSDIWKEINQSRYSNAIIRGAREEDSLPNPIHHFYDADWIGERKGLWGIGDDAISRAENFYNQAINLYQNNIIEQAYKTLGHVLHLVQDMSVPYHVTDVEHPFFSPYEDYVRDNWNDWIGNYINSHIPTYLSISRNNFRQYQEDLANYSKNYKDFPTNESDRRQITENLITGAVQFGAGMINQFWDDRNRPNPNDPGGDHPDDNYGVLSAPTLFLDPGDIGDWKNYLRLAMKKNKMGVLLYKQVEDMFLEIMSLPEGSPQQEQKIKEFDDFGDKYIKPNLNGGEKV